MIQRALDGTPYVATVDWMEDPPISVPAKVRGGGLVFAVGHLGTVKLASSWRPHDEHSLEIMRRLSNALRALGPMQFEYPDFIGWVLDEGGEVEVRHGDRTDYVAVMTPQIWREVVADRAEWMTQRPPTGAADASAWIQWENHEVWQYRIWRLPMCECDECRPRKSRVIVHETGILGPEKGAEYRANERLRTVVADYNDTLKEGPWTSSSP